MQASLQTGMPQPAASTPGQPFGSTMWTAKPWLMAAAAVSAVVMVTFGYWQQREINQLRDTISQLKKPATHQSINRQPKPTPPETTEPTKTKPVENEPDFNTNSTPGNNIAHQQPRDTVYITRYIAVPSKSQVVPPDEDRYAGRPETSFEQRDQRYATTNRGQKSVDQPNQSDNLTNNPNTDAYGELSTPSITSENFNSTAPKEAKTLNRSLRGQNLASEYTNNRETGLATDFSVGSTSIKRNKTKGWAKGSTPTQTDYAPASGKSILAESDKALTSATIESISSLPLSLGKTNWSGMLTLRAKRMRPARTTVVGGAEPAQAPESQRVNRPGLQFRAGIGGEVASKLTSAGVFTEALLGKHWVVSAGLSRATYSGDKFISDFDFDIRMRRNFRKEFAHGIDPRRDILNIDTRTSRLLIPVSIGYRVALSKTLSFVPTVGTYFTISSTENATYLCPVPIPQRGFEQLSVSDKRTVPLLNNVALSAGIEWQSRHWVLQGSPVLTIPIDSDPQPFQPGQNWQSSSLMGLRARLLYQF